LRGKNEEERKKERENAESFTCVYFNHLEITAKFLEG
jgi:hypothetical protein